MAVYHALQSLAITLPPSPKGCGGTGGRGIGSIDGKSEWHNGAEASIVTPMTGKEIKALPVDQKLQIMEAIWEDFRDRFDRMDIPQQQKDMLDHRRARVREGSASLLDWDAVKGTIGRP